MFGLTAEKLFVVAVLAVLIIGPSRMPLYAAKAGALLRRGTALMREAQRRAEEETGLADWRTLDPRQYDPRRIIREAWDQADAGQETREIPEIAPDPPEPSGHWEMAGTSAHPRRVWVVDAV